MLLLSMVWLFLLSLLGDLAATWSQSNGILWTATGMDLALLGYFGLLIYKVWFVASLRAVLSEA